MKYLLATLFTLYTTVDGTAPSVNQNDIELLASLITSESQTENYLDKLLVGSVVLNRMRKWEKTLSETIYQKNQFSGTNGALFTPSSESIIVARFLFENGPIDTTVMYFINPKIATNSDWLKKVNNRPLIVKNTNHYFYQ
jgi:spore germination cell wall hydrolase CwlJ-like protein